MTGDAETVDGGPDLPAAAERFVERVRDTEVTDTEAVREQTQLLGELLADHGPEGEAVVTAGVETTVRLLAATDDEAAVREAVDTLLREASRSDREAAHDGHRLRTACERGP